MPQTWVSPAPIAPAGIDVSFFSGMSATSDMRGAIDAMAPIGLVASRITLPAKILRIPGYLNSGGFVFIDSGAFAEVSTGVEPDWPRILAVYETIAELADDTSRLFVVGPDKVGDQEATLARLTQYRDRVVGLILTGCRVIVPLQRGDLSANEMLSAVANILGTHNFVAGIPSNKEALSIEECRTLVHGAYHILGRVSMNDEQVMRIAALRDGSPDARITADANWLRSKIALIRSATEMERQRRKVDGDRWHFDHPRAAAVTRSIQNCQR